MRLKVISGIMLTLGLMGLLIPTLPCLTCSPETFDVNGDGIVSISDVVIVALAFGSQPSDPNWNPIADLNSDGKVNIIDLVIVGSNFGKIV